MMKRVIENNRGMALIVALLTSFILLALVASLFWVIASTSRQSEYAKNSAIALNLAEAGTADAIYRLNYCTNSTDLYPFAGSFNSFGTSASDLFTLTTDIFPSSLFPNLITSGIKGTFPENGGEYYVGIQDNTYPDTLVAVGIYKGIRRILTISLRGNNDKNFARQAASGFPAGVTQGISEAFNKHAIYANTVNYTVGTVNGNIASTNDILTPIATNTGATKTKVSSIDNTYFPVFTPSTTSSTVPSWTYTYTNGNRPGGPGIPGVPDFSSDTYGTYSGGVYNFTLATLPASHNLYFQDGATGPPTVNITNLTTIINCFIGTTGILTLSGSNKTINNGVFFQPAGGITVSGITIINNLIVKGGPLTLDGVTVNGAVLCDNSITLLGSASTITVPSANTTDAAILIKSTAGATVTIFASPTITLGANQKAAVIAYSNGGAVVVNVNANLTPTLSSGQAGIIVFTNSANNATINTGNAGAATVNGLVYAYSSGAVGNITLDALTGTINGALVANGTVTLNGGILNYGTPEFTGVNPGSDIYQGFSGGRRAYVPTWQGWGLK